MLALTGYEDKNVTGDLDILGNITLKGEHADLTRIDAGGLDRAIHVLPGVVLMIRELTITGGRAVEFLMKETSTS